MSGALHPENLVSLTTEDREAREFQRERARTVIDALVTGYHEGSIKLEALCRHAARAASMVHADDQWLADAMIGKAVRYALSIEPTGKGVGNKATQRWITQLCIDLAPMVKEREDLTLTVDGVFRRVAEIFAEAGINNVTANTAEKAWRERSQPEQ